MKSIQNPTPTRSGITALIAVLLIGSTVEARNTATPEFRKGESEIAKIALLPPHATLTVLKVGADESMIVDSAELEKHGSDESVEHLETLGYQVTRFTPDQINADSTLRDLMLRVNERYEESYDRVRRRPGQVKNRRYNLGEESQLLAAYLNVDALAFQRINVAGAAAGQMTLSLLLGNSSSGAFFNLAIVDAGSGDIVGFFYEARGLLGKKNVSEPESLVTDMIRAAFKGFPKADMTAADAKSAQTSDIAELEALLEEDEKDD